MFRTRHKLLFASLLPLIFAVCTTPAAAVDFTALKSPILFQGDAVTAYRDPTAVYHDGAFRVFFSLIKTEPGGKVYIYTAWSKSRDLLQWTEPKIITPRDRHLNLSSPGNIVRFGGRWVLCLQTYPRRNGEKYGNETARVWIMRSDDLKTGTRLSYCG